MANQQARDDAIMRSTAGFRFGNHLFASKQPAIGFVNDDASGVTSDQRQVKPFRWPTEKLATGWSAGGGEVGSATEPRRFAARWGWPGGAAAGGLRRHRRLLVKGCHHLF